MEKEFKNIDAVLKEDLENEFGEKVEVVITRPHRVFVTINRDDILDVVKYLRENHGLIYISTITGLDAGGDHFEMLYHFLLQGTSFTIKAIVPYDDPVVDSITPIIPGAMLYERETHDLLGIYPKGHPNLVPVVLPEDWPEGEYPLRKSWPPEERGIR